MNKKEPSSPPSPVGLINHGNTCFMNSVIQGLLATKSLEELIMFRNSGHSGFEPPTPQRSPLLVNGRGPEGDRKEKEGGMPVGTVFIRVLEKAWAGRDAGDKKEQSPRELLNAIGKKYGQYLDFRQQDAHEFLGHLLDSMRMEELDIIKKRSTPIPVGDSAPTSKLTSKTPSISLPDQEQLMPFVNMLWNGRLTSVLVCETCKHISHTYESFDDLSLPITREGSNTRKRDRFKAAVKFITAYRTREAVKPEQRPRSQPPSPTSSSVPLQNLRDTLTSPKARSHESVFQPVDEDGAIIVDQMDLAVPEERRSRKVSDTGLSGLGRRISMGMAFHNRKEKERSSRANKEQRVQKDGKHSKERRTSRERKDHKADKRKSMGWHEMLNVVDTKLAERRGRSSPTPMSSNPSSPFLPLNGTPLEPELIRSTHRRILKEAYLRRLLTDPEPVPPASHSPTHVQTLEDCLKRFTATEVLDGIGCRNCWKISNGLLDPAVDGDTSTSDEEDSTSTSSPGTPPSLHGTKSLPDNLTSDSGLSSVQKPVETPSNSSPVLVEMSASTSPGVSQMPSPVLKPMSLPASPSDNDHRHMDALMRHVVSRTEGLGLTERPLPSIFVAPTSPIRSDAEGASTPGWNSALSTGTHTPSGIVSPPRNALHLKLPGSRPRSNHEQESSAGFVTETDAASNASTISKAPKKRRQRPDIPKSKQIIPRRAAKRYLVATAPPVLIIHLRRFFNSSSTDIPKLKKNDEYVSFPEFLDLQSHLAPKPEDYGLGKGELEGKIAEKGQREEDKRCRYRLYAVLVHIGSMVGGHYVAYTASSFSEESASASSETQHGLLPNGKAVGSSLASRQWYHISDTKVRAVNLDEVLQARAYMCMYERIP